MKNWQLNQLACALLAGKRERAANDEIISRRCAAWVNVPEDRSHFGFIPENVKVV